MEKKLPILLNEHQHTRACSILRQLTPREEQIVRLRFGIGERAAYSLEEIRQRFAVTRERIRQIEVKALRKLGMTAHEDPVAFLTKLLQGE